MENPRRSSRRRINAKRKSDIVYFDDPKDKTLTNKVQTKAKIELNDEERNLLYPDKPQDEKRFCICNRTELETQGLTMIMCDICMDWFHDECIGMTSEEMENLDSFICPKCSGKPFKLPVKRPQPSSADIEILLTALAEIDEEKPKLKKRQVDVQASTHKISVFHLAQPINTGRYNNVIGYIRNDSHPNPNEDNGNIIPITLGDIDRGIVCSSWGNFKVSSTQDGRLLVSKDYSFRTPMKDFKKKEEEAITHSVPVADIEVENEGNQCIIKCDDSEDLIIPTADFSCRLDNEKAQRLTELFGIDCSWKSLREAINSKIKHKPSILLKVNAN
ncbi:unnamed protein product [Blepharisma stoltei]|uniref:PHD-type domain-containing protein n=1 Tax=Blepharisma stoltei TaxID=1481888 RepID=A0AAU9IP55_9CILI|nr:unnamed protein product [Blepharisma stoltei]